MDLKLSGRIAVVTGASKGIGLATTRTLLEEGARVVAASRKTTPAEDEAPVDLRRCERRVALVEAADQHDLETDTP